MRVLSFGCTQGRVSSRSYAFSPGYYSPPRDSKGHYDPDVIPAEDDTRLPSERMGLNKPILAPAPAIFSKPKQILAGASG